MTRRYLGVFTRDFYNEEEQRMKKQHPEATLNEIRMVINEVFKEQTEKITNETIDKVFKNDR